MIDPVTHGLAEIIQVWDAGRHGILDQYGLATLITEFLRTHGYPDAY